MASPLRAIFFDLDNTLCDIEAGAGERFRAAVAAIARHDSRMTEAQLLERVTTISTNRGRLLALLEEMGLEGHPAGLAAVDAEEDVLFRQLTPSPDVHAALEELKAHFTLGVITNGPSERQRRKLDVLNLAPLFSVVIVDTEVGWSKPDARIFRAAIEAIGGRAEETLYVGDRWEVDVVGAANAGLRAVWIAPQGQGDPPGLEATFVLNSVTDLPDALRAAGLL